MSRTLPQSKGYLSSLLVTASRPIQKAASGNQRSLKSNREDQNGASPTQVEAFPTRTLNATRVLMTPAISLILLLCIRLF